MEWQPLITWMTGVMHLFKNFLQPGMLQDTILLTFGPSWVSACCQPFIKPNYSLQRRRDVKLALVWLCSLFSEMQTHPSSQTGQQKLSKCRCAEGDERSRSRKQAQISYVESFQVVFVCLLRREEISSEAKGKNATTLRREPTPFWYKVQWRYLQGILQVTTTERRDKKSLK